MATLFGIFAGNASAVEFKMLNSSGVWTGTSGGDNVTGIGTNEVRWGGIILSQKSGLRFDGTGEKTFEVDENFQVGTLTHFNNNIGFNNSADSAELEIGLLLSELGEDKLFNFSFGIDETTNVEPCTYPSDTPCSDKISFPSAFPEESFSFMGENYTLKLLGFGDSADNFEEGFISQEGGTNSTFLFAQITEDPDGGGGTVIPEPMTILGSFAAIGIGGLIKKKNSKN